MLPNGDGQGLRCVCLMCACVSVEVTPGRKRERGRGNQSDRWGDRKSMGELSVPVCMVILGPVSNNHTALNGKAAQEGG